METSICFTALIGIVLIPSLASSANAGDVSFAIFGAENRINSRAVADQLSSDSADMSGRYDYIQDKHGFIVGGGISSAPLFGLSYGLEVAYRRNGFDVSNSEPTTDASGELSGQISVLSAMLTAGYEYGPIGDSAVSAVLSLGAGYARLRTVLDNEDLKTAVNKPAFQVGGGLKLKHSERLSTSLEYRYFRAIVDGTNVDTDYVGHGVYLGLHFQSPSR